MISLNGNLGAGKTTFAQGFAKGMGIKQHVGSPTFKLVSEYIGDEMNLYHVDCYRLNGIADFLNMGGETLLLPENISVNGLNQLGITGDTGSTGKQGIKGDIGFTGSPGQIGATGPTGLQGIQGNSGIQGAKGDKGEMGKIGPTGQRGESFKIDDSGPLSLSNISDILDKSSKANDKDYLSDSEHLTLCSDSEH